MATPDRFLSPVRTFRAALGAGMFAAVALSGCGHWGVEFDDQDDESVRGGSVFGDGDDDSLGLGGADSSDGVVNPTVADPAGSGGVSASGGSPDGASSGGGSSGGASSDDSGSGGQPGSWWGNWNGRDGETWGGWRSYWENDDAWCDEPGPNHQGFDSVASVGVGDGSLGSWSVPDDVSTSLSWSDEEGFLAPGALVMETGEDAFRFGGTLAAALTLGQQDLTDRLVVAHLIGSRGDRSDSSPRARERFGRASQRNVRFPVAR